MDSHHLPNFGGHIQNCEYYNTNQTIAARRPMRLWAIVNDNAGRPVKNVKWFWYIDGKEVSKVRDTWIIAPATGHHTCLLQVKINRTMTEHYVEFETKKVDA